jgi:hypothetical protein
MTFGKNSGIFEVLSLRKYDRLTLNFAQMLCSSICFYEKLVEIEEIKKSLNKARPYIFQL